ncbi:hypothetical protein ACFXNW_28855 [Nocardia sp. NPDC059180]|uniref:hypothetical protein n=1 Tax=Nocardia sp. NPDC059180 TaxID=3346761 RepID=UPI0036B27999
MTSGELDALAIARRQLQLAMADELYSPASVETRVQLGLLASNIALAERLGPAGLREPEPFRWELPLLETFVRELAPKARGTLRLLCDEGGSATPARLMELTGAKSLAGLTNAIRRATHDATRDHPHSGLPAERALLHVEYSGRPNQVVVRYYVDPDVLPLLKEAINRVEPSE